MCIISTSAIYTSPKSEEKNPCFLLFPNSGWKVWVWRPTVAPSQVFISFLHPPRYLRTGLLVSCLVLNSFFDPGFFLNSGFILNSCWKVCVWRPPRGPMHSFHPFCILQDIWEQGFLIPAFFRPWIFSQLLIFSFLLEGVCMAPTAAHAQFPLTAKVNEDSWPE